MPTTWSVRSVAPSAAWNAIHAALPVHAGIATSGPSTQTIMPPCFVLFCLLNTAYKLDPAASVASYTVLPGTVRTIFFRIETQIIKCKSNFEKFERFRPFWGDVGEFWDESNFSGSNWGDMGIFRVRISKLFRIYITCTYRSATNSSNDFFEPNIPYWQTEFAKCNLANIKMQGFPVRERQK
jgi:hypothetical protein